jgi:hypothetical protein
MANDPAIGQRSTPTDREGAGRCIDDPTPLRCRNLAIFGQTKPIVKSGGRCKAHGFAGALRQNEAQWMNLNEYHSLWN